MSYNLSFSGEQIDQAIENALPLITGRSVFTIPNDTGSSYNFYNFRLTLPFTPNNNTKIVGSISAQMIPSPFLSYNLMFLHMSDGLYAHISVPHGSGTLQAGTYFLDWIVFDQG